MNGQRELRNRNFKNDKASLVAIEEIKNHIQTDVVFYFLKIKNNIKIKGFG